MSQCYSCGSEIQKKEKIGREAPCPKCGRYLHCCLNCRFYSPDSHHQCREDQAEWVRDKEAANFCDYFELNPLHRIINSSMQETARKKLDELFKKKP